MIPRGKIEMARTQSYWIIVSRLLSQQKGYIKLNTFNELMPRLKKRNRKTTFITKFNK